MAPSVGSVRVFMHKEIIPGFGVLKEKLPVFVGQSHMKPVHVYIVILGAGGFLIKRRISFNGFPSWLSMVKAMQFSVGVFSVIG